MIQRILIFGAGIVLAAAGIFAAAPQAGKAGDAIQAARMNNLGMAYMNQQLFEKALTAFQEAGKLDPKLQIAQLNQGIALLNLGRMDAAAQILETAAKQYAKDPNVWFNLGLLYRNMSNSQAATDAFRHVVEIDPEDADTWYFLGTVYSQTRQFPQAIDAFEHALKLNPLHASAEFGLSRALQQSGDLAHAREHLQRFQYIQQKKLGAPISLIYGEQGKYSMTEESAAAPEKVPAEIPVKFVPATDEAGLSAKPTPAHGNDLASFLGPGACFLDYDGDGRIDLFLADNGPQGGMALYHNLGNGKFEDVTKKAGLDPTLHGVGCTAGDYDNDGATDLAVSFNGRVLLLHNDKNGTFKDVTESVGIKADGSNLGLTFVDYDHDGDLDLYITRSTGNVMWRNNGNNTFTDVTETLGLGGKGASIAAVGSDYNNDRAVDLVLTSAQRPRSSRTL